MKRTAAVLILLCCVFLTSCQSLVSSQYVQISAHNPKMQQTQNNAVSVDNAIKLRETIRNFVMNGVEHGTIRVYSYDTELNADLASAVYEIWREDPIGSYAVEFITYDCSLIVSYYEVHVDITYRRSASQIDALRYLPSSKNVKTIEMVREAIDAGQTELTMFFTNYTDMDFEQIVRDYYDEKPMSVMVMPKVTVNMYPSDGTKRIAEINFQYGKTYAELSKMKSSVKDNLNAAAVYVRYCESEHERASLLVSYLSERFDYQLAEDGASVYSLLCEGKADSISAAKAWKLLCDATDLECSIVKGTKNGEEYWWNITKIDGQYFHVNLLHDLLDEGKLHLRYDSAMADYVWDRDNMVSCSPQPVQTPAPPTEAETAALEEQKDIENIEKNS